MKTTKAVHTAQMHMLQSTFSHVVAQMVEQKLSTLMTKQIKWHVRPAKTQISLGIRPVCPHEESLGP